MQNFLASEGGTSPLRLPPVRASAQQGLPIKCHWQSSPPMSKTDLRHWLLLQQELSQNAVAVVSTFHQILTAIPFPTCGNQSNTMKPTYHVKRNVNPYIQAISSTCPYIIDVIYTNIPTKNKHRNLHHCEQIMSITQHNQNSLTSLPGIKSEKALPSELHFIT